MIKNIIFDFDGVLTNSEGLGRKVLAELIKNENLSGEVEIDKSTGRLLYNGKQITPGTNMHDIFKLIFPDKSEEYFSKWYNLFEKEYHNQVVTIENVEKTVPLLFNKKINLFIVSTKYASLIKIGLDKFDLTKYFKFVIGRETVDPPKPSSAPFDFLADKFKIKKEDTIYVGDTITDEKFAINTDLKFIYFASGVEDSIVKNYYKKITNFSEIMKIVENENQNL